MAKAPSAARRLVVALRQALCMSEQWADTGLLDAQAIGLLTELANPENHRGHTGGRICSERQLADDLLMSRRAIRVRLRALAHWGVLRVWREYRPRERRWSCSQVELNPFVRSLMAGGPIRATDLSRHVKQLAELAACRTGLMSDDDLQGFTSHVPYGEAESDQPGSARDQAETWLQSDKTPPPVSETSQGVHSLPPNTTDAAGREFDAQRAEAAKKASKRELARTWHLLGREFVKGAATIWDLGQQYCYQPSQRPAWDGELARLSPTNQRSYRELVRVLEHEGGFRTCLAWFIFCTVTPRLGKGGRIEFDPKAPHRQWSTVDKQPSFFAKHFNAICADPDFRGYAEDPDITTQLVKVWGAQMVNLRPRWEREPTKLGEPAGRAKWDLAWAPHPGNEVPKLRSSLPDDLVGPAGQAVTP